MNTQENSHRDSVESTRLFAESISDARRFRLKQALLALANWAEARAGGNHNTETTITMLEHRIAQIRDQVDRAGWAASNSANAKISEPAGAESGNNKQGGLGRSKGSPASTG